MHYGDGDTRCYVADNARAAAAHRNERAVVDAIEWYRIHAHNTTDRRGPGAQTSPEASGWTLEMDGRSGKQRDRHSTWK